MGNKSYEKANFVPAKGRANFKFSAWGWRSGEILAGLIVVGALLRVLPDLWAVIDALMPGL